jgi:hypothetical protein
MVLQLWKLICFITFSLIFLAIQSCSVRSGNGEIYFTDPTGIKMDPIEFSTDHPTARYDFKPSKEAIKLAEGFGWERLEENYFSITTGFPMDKVIKQKTNRDCWAACTTMLFARERIDLNQDEFKNIQARLLSATNAEDELSIYLNFLNTKKKATYCKPISAGMLIDSIGNGHPLLVGFNEGNEMGHIMIVIGYYYSYISPTGLDRLRGRKINMAIDKLLLIDPAIGDLKICPPDYFKNYAKFAISFHEYSPGGLFQIGAGPGKGK